MSSQDDDIRKIFESDQALSAIGDLSLIVAKFYNGLVSENIDPMISMNITIVWMQHILIQQQRRNNNES